MIKDMLSELRNMTSSLNIYENEPLSLHTSFRIGGPADWFVTPSGTEEIISVIDFCRDNDIPYYVLGNGTNVLASDEGFRGVIIQICRRHDRVECSGNVIKAEAGALLSGISNIAKKSSLKCMEFASGIPGTLGGAVLMNAGAYGGEMKDIVSSVTMYSPDKGVITVPGSEMDFSYRHSRVKGTDDIILSAEMILEKGNADEIAARMDELKQMRTSKQPLEYPSAGSTFKRPEGYFAGKLIMDAGLKGFSIGGAQVSEKHCGFVINTGKATAKDVKILMEYVTKTVEERFGVVLEPEVIFLGQV